MKHAAVTYAADGSKIEGRGNTYPEAVRHAQSKAKQHNDTITQQHGVIYVRRDRTSQAQG